MYDYITGLTYRIVSVYNVVAREEVKLFCSSSIRNVIDVSMKLHILRE